jgi:hypothetical protein
LHYLFQPNLNVKMAFILILTCHFVLFDWFDADFLTKAFEKSLI